MIAAPELLSRIDTLNHQELAWLSGYCWAKIKQEHFPSHALEPVAEVAARKILILSASQTGNAKRVAEQLQQQLQSINAQVQLQSIGDYKNRDIAQEDVVILISSTQGEGEYPEEAISFAKFLFSQRAPKLEQLSFAVLGLGDSSYPLFCEAAKQFDQRFAELGATRLFERIDCDLAYEAQADQWKNDLAALLTEQLKTVPTSDSTITTSPTPVASVASAYSKEQPYTAQLITRQKITSRSVNKDVIHLEIDLGDSGLQYQAGDSLGIYVNNDPKLLHDFLLALNLDKNAIVQLQNKTETTLEKALSESLELTQNNVALIKKWAKLAKQEELQQLISDATALNTYAENTPLLAMVQQFPANIEAQQCVDFLRPLTPRMYSIASAQDEVGEEVHLTLGVVQYQHDERDYYGAASHYLAKQLQEDDDLRVFVEPNIRFRLPENPETPIIMIGAGTGVAPFRAFMQQRESDGATGLTWLIFGNQKFTDDFLYQSEWQRWDKLGLLHNTSFAWSRQNPNKKVYVQDKILENAEQIWQWLQKGAHIYVCGDANHMAKSVEQALLHVIQQAGQLNAEHADEFLDQLRDDRRYQRDVY